MDVEVDTERHGGRQREGDKRYRQKTKNGEKRTEKLIFSLFLCFSFSLSLILFISLSLYMSVFLFLHLSFTHAHAPFRSVSPYLCLTSPRAPRHSPPLYLCLSPSLTLAALTLSAFRPLLTNQPTRPSACPWCRRSRRSFFFIANEAVARPLPLVEEGRRTPTPNPRRSFDLHT